MTLDYVREDGSHGTLTVPDVLHRETCDRCGPNVAATHTFHTASGPLTFCGHDTRAIVRVMRPGAYLVTQL